jgi:hypothetical protein
MTYSAKILIGLGLVAVQICSGCASRSPSGPDGGYLPVFSMNALPPQITKTQNAQIYLTPTLPNEFKTLHSRMTLFSSSSGYGFFNVSNDISYIDTAAVSKLNPEVWYLYNGPDDNVVDTIFAYVVDVDFDTLAWNYCTIAVVGNQ